MTRFLQPRLTKKVCLTIVIAFLILIGTVAIFIFWNVRTPKLSHTESAFHMESVTQKVKNETIKLKTDTDHLKKNNPKLILYWNKYFNDSDMRFGFGQQPFINAGCEISNCIATDDRNLFNQSNGIIIHAGNYEEDDLPNYRFPHQRFIFLNFETLPEMSFLPCFSRRYFYNWTMTYRRDSDVVYHGIAYGGLRRHRNSVSITQLPPKLTPGELPPKPEDLLLNKNVSKKIEKKKFIAWFNSHCLTHSKREDYVKKLTEFIPVDVYGTCGHLKCLPWMDSRCDTLLQNYRFYFAAENSLCPDYVTEKVYRALMNNAVPIVYGGADYTQYAPSNSYINVADFKSPKDLAEYLLLLSKNDALYNKYFDWKKDYEVIKRPLNGWCDLCAKLNDLTLASKSYANVAKWWYDESPCLPGSTYLRSILQTNEKY